MAGGGGWVVISEQGRIEQMQWMNQAIMQGPSVCVLILQQAAFLAAEWEVVIQRKSAGGKINEISICVTLFGRHPSCEHVE